MDSEIVNILMLAAPLSSTRTRTMEMARMIPPLVPVRARKRCDDDSASTENDSMRPLAPEPRRAKRRRLLDAFSSISLQKEEELASTSGMEVASPRRKSADKNRSSDTIINNMVASSSPRCATLPGKSDDNDADSSQAVAEDDDGYTTNSSLDVEDGDTEDGAEDEDDPMLSDKEASKNDVERKVMFELVFGPDSNFVLHSKSPVDRQLDRLLQSTWKKQAAAATTTSTPAAAEDEPSTRAAITKHPFATPAENHPTTTVAAGATHGAFFLKQTIATATQDDICVYPPPASIATNSYAYYYPSAPTDASTVSTSTTFSSLDESRSGCVADVGVDDVDCSKIRGTVDPKNHNNNNTNSVSSSISSKSNGSIGSSSQGRHDGYSVELKRCNSLPELHRHPSSMDTVVEEMDTAEE